MALALSWLAAPAAAQTDAVTIAMASCGAMNGEPTPAPSAPIAEGARCLPVVHGCGCAYACGLGSRRDDGRYDVTHDFQDSRADVADLERRCFDAAGHAFSEAGAPPEATRCIGVFYDRTPCGGECIQTTAYLDCALADRRCAPR
jgi:hypothetical protein